MNAPELPLISVVIPSFNQAIYLREALDSILRQNYPRLEILVLDGGSTDHSVEILRAYEHQLTFWQSTPDGGQAAAINDGIRRSTGDIVAWLNSDDFYWGNALWVVADAYISHPGFGLYLGNGMRFDQASREYRPFCPHHMAFKRRVLTEGLDYVLQPSAFFWSRAWQEVGGLNEDLHYCMDWDVLVRIAQRYPVVSINEFLSVSREHGETKTSTGKLQRAAEICRMTRAHSTREITPGALYYLLETLLDVVDQEFPGEVRHLLYSGMRAMTPLLTGEPGNQGCFPFFSDPQDRTVLPFARASSPARPAPARPELLPSISIVTPSFNQVSYLGQTLDSVFNQSYPKLELIVMDGGSTDGSVDVLETYDSRLTYWRSEPDRGPAHAINKGLARAGGEIVAWLNSDDMLADGALQEVAKRFQEDPALDMVYANALYIDEENRLFLADHGIHKTGFYYGKMQPLQAVPEYWSYVHAVPQPTVFFRRRLLESCGFLDESYQFIFDFEFFFRLMGKAKIEKIERTQAFYRIHSASKTSDWSKFLVELYRFSRGRWPRRRTVAFQAVLKDFVASYMRRRFPERKQDARYWITAATVALSAATGIGNPEAMRFRFMQAGRAGSTPAPAETSRDAEVFARFEPPPPRVPKIDRRRVQYRTVFCSFLPPRHPGHSGGEIRDFHLLRRLLSISRVDFLALYDAPGDDRTDLRSHLEHCWTPLSLESTRPEWVQPEALELGAFSRLAERLRTAQVPMLGFRYHQDVTVRFPIIKAYAERALTQLLASDHPDFLIVSPQLNPLALAVPLTTGGTRLVMASYDVESVRMQRMVNAHPARRRFNARLEARRARRFERHNLAFYDGVIAVSELDKTIFQDDFAFDPDRVLVIENGVDTQYFEFTGRAETQEATVVLIGNFGYLPNRQAALRLLREIMPLVRRRWPQARAWIVGSGADKELKRAIGSSRDVVTGPVADVRPYLKMASVACIPLLAGSGTKYKILEAMSAGVPVVCTPLAAEGLELEHLQHVMLGVTNEELAGALTHLLGDPEGRAGLASRARLHVEQRFSWDGNLARLDPWLEHIRQLPPRAVGTRPA